MTYCRFCGAPIAPDSVFCSKCGRRLGTVENPRVERIVGLLRLRTPYPYAGVLLMAVAAWMWTPGKPPTDYSAVKISFQEDRKLDLPAENLYQEGLSLILENVGSSSLREIPVEFHVSLEPPQPSAITANFLGQRIVLMDAGKPLPWTVVLADEVRPGAKRSFFMETAIEAASPFKATYEIRKENSAEVLAHFVVQR